jgi:hypothetical protein
MLEAPALSLLLLLGGAVGLLDEHVAVNLALWAGVAQLPLGCLLRAARLGTGPVAGRRGGQRIVRGGHHRARGVIH